MMLFLLVLIFIADAKLFQVDSNKNTLGDFSLGKGFDSSRFEPMNSHVFLEDLVSFDFVPLISSSMNCAVIQQASDVRSKLGLEGSVSMEYLFFSGEGFFSYDEENEEMRKRVILKCIIDRTLFTISINPPNLKNEDECNFSELPFTTLPHSPQAEETATSGEACAMLCCVKSWCKSADFNPNSRECLLYDQSAAVMGLESSDDYMHFDLTQAFAGLNPAAQKIAKNSDVNKAKQGLATEFGLEYVNSITYGRRYEVEIGMTYSHKTDYEKVSAKIKGEAQLGAFKVSAEFKFENEKQNSDSSLEMNIASKTLGFLEKEPLSFPSGSDSAANAGAELMRVIEANMGEMIAADDKALLGQSNLKKRDILPLLRGAYPLHFTTASSKPYFPVLSLDKSDMETISRHLDQAYGIKNNLETMLGDIEDRSKGLYSNFDLLSGRTELSVDFLQTKFDLTKEIQTVLSYVKDYIKQSAEEILEADILSWAFDDPRVNGLDFLTVDLLTTKIENLMGLGDLEMNDASVIGDRCIFHGIQADVDGTNKKFAGTVQFADFEVRHVIFDQSQQVVSLGYIRDKSAQGDELVYVRSDCSVVRKGSEIWYRGARYEVTKIGNDDYVKNGRVEKSLLKNVRVYIKPQDADRENQFLLTVDELQDPSFGLRGAEHSLSFTVDDEHRLMFRDGYVCDTGFGMPEAKMLCTVLGYARVDSFRTNVELPKSNAYGMARTTMNHLSCDSQHTNTQTAADFLTSGLCSYDTENIACSAQHGIELICEYESETENEEICKVDLWAGSNMEIETHECATASTGFGLYHIKEECNGREEYDGINSVEVSGCCVALLDEQGDAMCALSGGSFVGTDFSSRCGNGKAIKYETIRMESTFLVGGTVSGTGGETVTLVNHDNMESLDISGDGPFTFQQQVHCGAQYDVRVSSQSSNSRCTVQHGTGFVLDESIEDITISCIPPVTSGPTQQPVTSGPTQQPVTSGPTQQPTRSPYRGCATLSSESYHNCAVRSSGSITCWGIDNGGQVSNTPNVNDFVGVSGGAAHNCGLRASGSITCWGYNGDNQVSQTPTTNDFAHVSSGGYHTCGLRSSGSIACWGQNSYNQVSLTPSESDFVGVSGGGYHTCGLRASGSITCWGQDNSKQVSHTPSGNDFVGVSSGWQHNCGLRTRGSITCWGHDSYNQVSQTPSESDFVGVSSGTFHNCGLRTSGSITCWGRDRYGQVSQTPTDNDFVYVSSGSFHNCGLRTSGSITCWGRDNHGQVSQTPTDNDFEECSISLP